MGVAELREAFNSVSEPKATCNLATQAYERAGGKEWQVLVFRGTTQDGGTFEIKSARLEPRTDLNLAAREAAQQLLENDKP
jgi:hypothetical protein